MKRTRRQQSSISTLCSLLQICRVSPFFLLLLVDALAFQCPLFQLHPPPQRRGSSRNNTPSLHSFISPAPTARRFALSELAAHQQNEEEEEKNKNDTLLLSSLEQCTVLELRQRVRDTHPPRGVVSQLQRKQDLLEYLVLLQQEPQPQQQLKEQPEPVEATTTATSTRIVSTKRKSAVPLQMPPKPVVSKKNKNNNNTNGYESPKDLLFEKVLQRYPTAQYNNNNNIIIHNNPDDDDDTSPAFLPVDDVRQEYHPVLQSFSRQWQSTDLDLILVGTASCMPSLTRGVSCTALRFNWKQRTTQLIPNAQMVSQPPQQQQHPNQQQPFGGGIWLFDVGECTQLQVQKTPAIKPSKITKIFVTHAHGDHSFGLPGLLCLLGQDRSNSSNNNNSNNDAGTSNSNNRARPPIEIYGPEGLRMWLRVAIRYSVSRIVPPYVVHELCEVPMAPEWEYQPRAKRYICKHPYPRQNQGRSWIRQGLAGEDPVSWISQANLFPLEPSQFYGEIANAGRNLYPDYNHPLSVDGAPVWNVCDEGDVWVRAAPMSHGIPCVGYVVEERPRVGRLRQEVVEPLVCRNLAALREAGFAIPMKAMAVIKNLPSGGSFTFPDGTVLRQEDAVEPPRQGRKIVICGDTADARSLQKLAWRADVVVHEATNAYLAGIDVNGDMTSVTRDAVKHGHSTPVLAGDFARRVQAQLLVLTHFSSRYKGDAAVDSLSIMMRIEQQAMEASGLNETRVVAGWDMMVLPVPPSLTADPQEDNNR